MDLFLINGHDGVSLSDMIDWDIKLSDSDISEEVGVNNLMGIGYDLPSLDIEDEPSTLWAQSYSANSNSSFELDLLGVDGAATMMVEPSSVMPFMSRRPPASPVHASVTTPETAGESASVLKTRDSPLKIKIEKVFPINYDDERIKIKVVDEDETEGDSEGVDVEDVPAETVSKAHSKVGPLEFVSVPMDKPYVEVEPTKKMPPKRQVAPSCDFEVKSFPKPAYSYSCLIAMSLKNSQTGSLPVSEIYSFMCHHFPYFKTAPSGWKNSVRHNLSLNKCFEKIEKPHSSSGAQRKGCLWAMNPAKITKMDEEVAKWSRKDPLAIKNAMVYPENLELLERGEMKDEAAFVEGETEDDPEDIKEDEEFGVDVEDERISPIGDESDDEISRIPPSLQPFEPKFANLSRYKIIDSETLSEIKGEIKAEVDFELGFSEIKSAEDKMEMDFELDAAELNSTRSMLGLDDSTPIYAVDPVDDNVLIELPLVKKPRVQANYIYQPVLNMKRHNIGVFRSLKIKSP